MYVYVYLFVSYNLRLANFSIIYFSIEQNNKKKEEQFFSFYLVITIFFPQRGINTYTLTHSFIHANKKKSNIFIQSCGSVCRAITNTQNEMNKEKKNKFRFQFFCWYFFFSWTCRGRFWWWSFDSGVYWIWFQFKAHHSKMGAIKSQKNYCMEKKKYSLCVHRIIFFPFYYVSEFCWRFAVKHIHTCIGFIILSIAQRNFDTTYILLFDSFSKLDRNRHTHRHRTLTHMHTYGKSLR